MLAGKNISTDPRGNETLQWTEYTAPAGRTVKTQSPASSVIAETVVIDGYAVSRKDHAGVLTTSSRAYTASGSTETYTDARGNAAVTVFDIAGRETARTDAAGNTTAIQYDPSTASPSCVTDALGNTACYAYDPRGRKTAEYGTALQPSVFGYDDADRLVSLMTFRVPGETIAADPRERTDGDVTAWSYDDASGLMTVKTYADGHGESYSYDDWNRLAVKRQARTADGQGTPLATSYAYDSQTGNLVSVTHNDATPSITCTYTLTCSRRSRTIPARGRWLTTNIMKRNRKLRQGWRQARSTICATVWGGLRVTVCITGRALSSRRPGNMTVADVFLRFRSITAPIPSSMVTTPSTDCWKRLITPIPSGDGTPGKKNGIC